MWKRQKHQQTGTGSLGWRCWLFWGSVAMTATLKIASLFRFPEAPCKNVVCCLYSSPHSLTKRADQRQKQKLGWRHWLGQCISRGSCSPTWLQFQISGLSRSHTQHWVLTPPEPFFFPPVWLSHPTCSFHSDPEHLSPSISSPSTHIPLQIDSPGPPRGSL